MSALIRSCLLLLVLAVPATAQLNDSQRAYIDQYLRSHELNQYGDPEGTMYTGGTPLFDERTGRTTDRYVYILQNHPGILRGYRGDGREEPGWELKRANPYVTPGLSTFDNIGPFHERVTP